MKRQSEDSEKQTSISAIGFLSQAPATLQSHVQREHSSLPQPTAISLFSQQGIVFPVLTLVLAQIISCLMLLPDLQVC